MTRLLACVTIVAQCSARLVLPSSPPMGFNSFDIQYDRRANPQVPIWNETLFRQIAPAMATQLLPHGYDTIVIDGGWSAGYVDENGRPTPNPGQWPSAAEGVGFKALADWTHSLGLKFGVWSLRGVLPYAVQHKLAVKGSNPPTTIDQIIYQTCDSTKSSLPRWTPRPTRCCCKHCRHCHHGCCPLGFASPR